MAWQTMQRKKQQATMQVADVARSATGAIHGLPHLIVSVLLMVGLVNFVFINSLRPS